MSRFYFERNLYIFYHDRTYTSKEEGIYKKDLKQGCNCIWTDMLFVQIKHHPPWVIGNDALAPKPCLNLGSSSDEDFTGSKTASLAAVFVYNFFLNFCVLVWVSVRVCE